MAKLSWLKKARRLSEPLKKKKHRDIIREAAMKCKHPLDVICECKVKAAEQVVNSMVAR